MVVVVNFKISSPSSAEQDDTGRKIRDARMKLLLEENERVRNIL